MFSFVGTGKMVGTNSCYKQMSRLRADEEMSSCGAAFTVKLAALRD